VVGKWARRHKAAVRAAAVVLLVVALLVGGIGLLWLQKRAWAAGEAAAALDEATRLQQDEQWSEALSAVRRAEAVLVGTWPDAHLCQQIEQRTRDLEMARRLEEARLKAAGSRTNVFHGLFILVRHGESQGEPQLLEGRISDNAGRSATTDGKALQDMAGKNGRFDWEGADGAYGEAFVWYDLGMYVLDPRDVAERIRSSSIAMQLIVALDDWAYARQKVGVVPCGPLVAAARLADPDPWRCRLRDALEGNDPAILLALDASANSKKLPPWLRDDLNARDPAVLQELAASANSEDLPPNTAVLLARLAEGTSAAEQALAVLRQVRQRHPGNFWLNHELASHLSRGGAALQEEALRYYTAAVALRPRSSIAHRNLGDALLKKGLLDEAIAEFRKAIRLQKDEGAQHFRGGVTPEGRLIPVAVEQGYYNDVHAKLAAALKAKGLLDEAGVEYLEDDGNKRGLARMHAGAGNSLIEEGKTDAAIAAYQEAIRLDKDNPKAHNGLGIALREKGRLDEAITEYKKAIRIKPDYADAHSNLGKALSAKGRLDEAIAEDREAIRLKKDFTQDNQNLNEAEARAWRAALAKLTAIQSGKAEAANMKECLTLAVMCQLYKRWHATSVRFYREAFAQKPRLADDLDAQHRYKAACSAALAGCGQGMDADKLDAKERARLRQQSLDWLRADLKAYGHLMEKSVSKAGPAIAELMQHWLKDEDFTGVRGDNALAKLPEDERAGWRKLWADVAEMLAQTQGKTTTEKKSDRK
jgi:tetratricopeptide (TPR) repeat protein